MKSKFYKAFILFPLILLANDDLISKVYFKCLKVANGATYDVVACMNKEEERLEKNINKVITKLESCLSKNRIHELHGAIESWSNYQEYKCGLYAYSSGGSGDLEDVSECLMDEASNFLDDLNSFVSAYCDE